MAKLTLFDLDSTTAGLDGSASYRYGADAVRLAPSATVKASGNFGNQSLTISGLLSEDVIGFASGVTIVGSSIKIGKTTIATFTGGSGGTNLVITFNSHAAASQVQTLIRNITFRDVSNNPTTHQTLTFNLAGTARTEAITITSSDHPPTVSA